MQFGSAVAPDTFRLERRLKAPIERVWSYFVDADKRSRWFNGGDDLTGLGQSFTFLFAHFRITNEEPPPRWAAMKSQERPMRGTILAFDPPNTLAFTWGDRDAHVSEVRFDFTADGEETVLVLTHTKIDTRDNMRNFAGGWTAHIQTLAEVLDEQRTNSFWAHVLEAHATYDRSL